MNKIGCVLTGFLSRVKNKISRELKKVFSCGTMYMLHRCAPEDGDALPPNENMKVYPEILDRQLSYFKKKYNCIAAKDVEEYTRHFHLKKFAAFTFDDGYRDNLTYALPVFKKHGIPFTVFVTTSFPDRTSVMWWYSLEELVKNNDCITLCDGRKFPCSSIDEKVAAFLDIRLEILKLDQTKLESELNRLFSNYSVDWKKPVDSLALSWSEIEELRKEPLVTLGAHTENHYSLKALPSEDSVRCEVGEGIRILKEHGIVPEIFAYPFGTSNEVSEREISVLENNDWDIRNTFLACGDEMLLWKKRAHALPRKILENTTIPLRRLK